MGTQSRIRIPKSLSDRTLGKPPRFDLKDRILNAVLLATATISLTFFITDILQGYLLEAIYFTGLMSLVYGTMYLLGRWRPSHRVLTWPYILISLSIPPFIWYYLGGVTGVALIFALALLLVIPFITEGRERVVAVTLFFTLNALLFYLELSGILLPSPYTDRQTEIEDTFHTFFFVGFAYNLVIALVIQALSERHQQIEELNQTKDKFLSIIGHDLKGPIANIMSLSGILGRKIDVMDADTRDELIRAIQTSSGNSYKLIENLLLWARSSSGILVAKPAPFDLDSRIRSLLVLYEEQLEAKEIQLRMNLAAESRIWADPDMFDTVIRNLVSNAIKFTPKGGSITVSTQREWERYMAAVSVRDTGVGMSRETQRKLFSFENRFYTQGTDNELGTGLGLKLCKEFVDKNQGTIDISSSKQKGTTVTVHWPLDTGTIGYIPQRAQDQPRQEARNQEAISHA